jgi:hypothetical protein
MAVVEERSWYSVSAGLLIADDAAVSRKRTTVARDSPGSDIDSL